MIKMCRKIFQSQGFTVVELILYMGLLSLFLVIITSIFSSSLDLQLESRSTSALDQDSRFLMERIGYDVARASSITTPSAIGEQGQELTIDISGQNYAYSLSNGNLILTTNQGSDQINSYDTSITSLAFQRLGNTNGKNTIRMTVTLQSKTLLAKGVESKTIQTTFGTR